MPELKEEDSCCLPLAEMTSAAVLACGSIATAAAVGHHSSVLVWPACPCAFLRRHLGALQR